MKPEERIIGGVRYRMESLGMCTAQEIILLLARPLASFMRDAAKGGVDLGMLRGAFKEGAAAVPDDDEAPEDDAPEKPEGGAKVNFGLLLLERVTAGLPAALRELRKAELKAVTDAFASRTQVEVVDTIGGKKTWVSLESVYNEHFDRRAGEWALWLFWGIQYNRLFGNVLEWFAALRERMGEAKVSGSPKGSTGSSGDSSSTRA